MPAPQDSANTTILSGDDFRNPGKVRTMFDRIARRYDLANHLLSGGTDFWWRLRVAGIVQQWQPARVLDLATGTGDLALAILRKLPHASLTGADFAPAMLSLAKKKGVPETVVADALALPFGEASFECVTVGFGLRNMADWSGALREMARVLAQGGRLVVLDFSMPAASLRPFYRFYLHRCLPALASVITGNKDAYDYLGASIEKFPSGSAMTALIQENGFRAATAFPLTGGIATIYTAEKA